MASLVATDEGGTCRFERGGGEGREKGKKEKAKRKEKNQQEDR